MILERLNLHKNPRIRDAIKAKRCELLFLPSYSPDLSPIELAFSKLKTWLREMVALTKGALDDFIATALKTITLQGVIGWFAHAGYDHRLS